MFCRPAHSGNVLVVCPRWRITIAACHGLPCPDPGHIRARRRRRSRHQVRSLFAMAGGAPPPRKRRCLRLGDVLGELPGQRILAGRRLSHPHLQPAAVHRELPRVEIRLVAAAARARASFGSGCRILAAGIVFAAAGRPSAIATAMGSARGGGGRGGDIGQQLRGGGSGRQLRGGGSGQHLRGAGSTSSSGLQLLGGGSGQQLRGGGSGQQLLGADSSGQ